MPSDATIMTDVDSDDGVSAFLANLTSEEPKRKEPAETSTPKDDEAPANREETSQEDGTEQDDGADNSDEQTETDPDDVEVDIKVGEETKKATIKELKRLYGQEAALTQKSQKLAETQRNADATFTKASTALTAMTERAKTAYEPYANLDWLVVAQQMQPEEFKALREDAATAKANLDFYEGELNGLQQQHQQTAQQAYREAATSCVEALSHPETGIEGWNEAMYNDLMEFATKAGAPRARMMTDPAAIKIIHMAYQWQKAEEARAKAKAKVDAVVNKPTKVLKPNASKAGGNTQQRSANEKLRRSGSVEDAAAAFEASF